MAQTRFERMQGAVASAQAISDRAQALTSKARAISTISAPAPPPPPAPAGTSGGGFSVAPVPWAQTQAGVTFAAQQQQALLGVEQQNAEALAKQQHADALARQKIEQEFQKQQQEKRLREERKMRAEERERRRQANIVQLRAERQSTFAQMMQSGDQTRAVMFALGYGPENDVFDVRARGLGTTVKELRGAQELRATTEHALSRILGLPLSRRAGRPTFQQAEEMMVGRPLAPGERRAGPVGMGQAWGAGRRGAPLPARGRQLQAAGERGGVTIGAEGVRGLGTAISSARAFVQGGADVQALLTSAFGVGSLRKGERPGISAARLQELIQSVVPTGIL